MPLHAGIHWAVKNTVPSMYFRLWCVAGAYAAPSRCRRCISRIAVAVFRAHSQAAVWLQPFSILRLLRTFTPQVTRLGSDIACCYITKKADWDAIPAVDLVIMVCLPGLRPSPLDPEFSKMLAVQAKPCRLAKAFPRVTLQACR